MIPHAGKCCTDADAEIARLREENERLNSQLASTADFLNTCLRESNLFKNQVDPKNLKLGIDALYLKIVALESRLAQAQQDAEGVRQHSEIVEQERDALNSRLTQARELATQVYSWGDSDPSGPCNCKTCQYLRALEELR